MNLGGLAHWLTEPNQAQWIVAALFAATIVGWWAWATEDRGPER